MRRVDSLSCAASAAFVQPGHSDSTQISIIEGRLQRSGILALRRLTLAGFSYGAGRVFEHTGPVSRPDRPVCRPLAQQPNGIRLSLTP